MTITRLLVANRGEIARRVFRTCRDLGIETVAVHADADAGLPFVREADAAVRLPGNTPAETYLRGDLVIEAANKAGADAIHPGYGFLSENAAFARQVAEAGLTWIGPAPDSIESMGSKIESKKLMEAAGVPVLGNLTVETATEGDLPLLVKASAGGGGRGMRVVRALADLPGEVAKAAAEAESAFGDGTVFVEPYVERGRHVEVQVVGDGSGGVLVFGERDCSLQRRHQKVVEEAPAPGLTEEVATALHEAARKAAEAISYRGAGTVEFLYDADTQRFYFLEMNTRLQVEHPVTEQVYGVDLVALQIAVAEGRGLPAEVEEAGHGRHETPETGAPPGIGRLVTRAAQAPRRPVGHAIEVRLYAEDPAADYAPQTGRLLALELDHDDAFALGPSTGSGTGPRIRLDTGFETGDEVSTFYDAMLSKVIAWAPTRDQAARALARTLETARIHGLVTNRDQLVASLRHPTFLDATMTTAFYDDHPDTLTPAPADELLPFVGAVALAEHRRTNAKVHSRIPAGFRNVVAAPQSTRFEVAGEEVDVRWYGGRAGYRSADLDQPVTVVEVSTGSTTASSTTAGSTTASSTTAGSTTASSTTAGSTTASSTTGECEVVLDVDGVTRRYDVRVVSTRSAGSGRAGSTDGAAVLVDGPRGGATLRVVPRFIDPADQVAEGSLLAPMPGTVNTVRAEVGDVVVEGQPILVMEAMKMQHTIAAPYAGTVTELSATAGQQVEAGTVLAVVEPAESGDQGDEA